MKKAISPIRQTSLFTLLLFGLATGAIAQDPPIIQKPAANGSPRIAVPEATHNWGKLLKGDAFEHQFTIRNEGDAPLLIENVKPT